MSKPDANRIPNRDRSGIRAAAGRGAVWIMVAALMLIAGPAQAGTGRRVIANPYTGLALDGHDPVSYFVYDAPAPGLARYEYRWAGVVWRFENAGNMAAFMDAPDVYAPRFGGYGALAVSRGFTAEGRPKLWAIFEDRLYLFYSPANRAVWADNPQKFVEQAARHWPKLSEALAR